MLAKLSMKFIMLMNVKLVLVGSHEQTHTSSLLFSNIVGSLYF